MKVGCLVNGTENMEVWSNVADALGIDGIDLTFATKEDYAFDADKINCILENRRVELCAVSMFHENTLDADSGKRKAAKEKNMRIIRFASDTGSRIAVINPGLLEGGSLEENIEAFKDEFAFYKEYSEKLGVEMSYYLGHSPNFIKSEEALEKVLLAVPDMHIKVDPVGVMRNMTGDPYRVVAKNAGKINHFHCKDIIRLDGYEIEPPVGMGDLRWNHFIAMLYEADYKGYLVIEPHGPKWGNKEKMCDYIKLSQRHLAQFVL